MARVCVSRRPWERAVGLVLLWAFWSSGIWPAHALAGPARGPAGSGHPGTGTGEPQDGGKGSRLKRSSLHWVGHGRQGFVSVGLGLGFRVIKPYADIWCGSRSDDPGNPNDPFCYGMSPLFLDLAAGYGVTDSLDVLARFRVGLTEDPICERHFLALHLGIRDWFNPHDAFKGGFGFEFLFDFTKQDGSKQKLPTYGVPEHDELDLGVRLYGTIGYDFNRYVGLYAEVGGLVGFLRWLRFELEGLVLVQARFP